MSVALQDMSPYARSIVERLGLETHPEGGWYTRDWQSPHTDEASSRPLSSLIYFLLPEGDAARCTQCGRCVALCPTQAIARGDELHTDPARCIRCCACVKGCAFGARTFRTPFAAALARNFARRKPPVTLL